MKVEWKKALSFLLTSAIVAGMAACSASAAGGEAESTAGITASPPAEVKTVAAGEAWTVTENVSVGRLELEPGAVVEADHPVIVFFEESDTVKNGDVMGEVQFVSDYDEIVAIVHTNDVHGYIDVEPYVKGYKTQLEESGKYSLVLAVNAGDVYAGGYAAAHIYDGEYITAVMSKVYDYMTWGNNDAGITDGLTRTYLLSLIGKAEGMESLVANTTAMQDFDAAQYAAEYEPTIGAEAFAELYSDVLSLNGDGSIDWSALDLESHNLSAGDDVLPDTAAVTTANGTVIGLFGETTQAGPEDDESIVLKADKDTIPTAAACVEALQDEGASVIVAICHTGWFSPDSTQVSSNDTNSAQIALNVPGLDAIVDGHTHSIICEGEGWLFDNTESKTIVNQASCWGGAIGLMELYIKDGKCIAKDCKNLSPEEFGAQIEPDAEVQAVVDACYDRLDADGYTTTLCESLYFLNGERLSANDPGGACRANETNLGDLVADGMVWAGKQLRDDISIALYPGVRVRSSIEAGDVTMLDVLGVFSSPIVIYYKTFTAQELVTQLDSALRKVGQEDVSFLQASGLELVYDSYNSVQSLTVNGELIYEDGVYYVDDDWSVAAAACDAGGNATYDEADILYEDNTSAAWAFRDFLLSGEYTIYPDEVAPAGRIVACEGYENLGSASGEPSGSPSGEPS